MEDCIDIDVNPDLKPDIVGDIRKLPFEDESVDGIVASHVLEHVPNKDIDQCMREWRRVLKMGGSLFIAVPDLMKACKYFLENYMGKRDYWYQCIYGARRYPGDGHQQGFTEFQLTEVLFFYGFHSLQWTESGTMETENLAVKAIKGPLRPSTKGEL